MNFKKLESLLQEINELFDELKNKKEEERDHLELELLEATTNYFLANINVGRRRLEQTDLAQMSDILDEDIQKELAYEPQPEPTYQPELEPVSQPEPEPQTVVPAPIVIDEQPIISKEEPTHDIPREVPAKPWETAQAPRQMPQDEMKSMSLNERIANQRLAENLEGSATPKFDGSRRMDLKTSINLNDKLMFIKELFNGYSLAYSEAIELINRYDSLAEADEFLQSNYAHKNNWADKPDAVAKLYENLKRRFA